jgi:hypothetical protein
MNGLTALRARPTTGITSGITTGLLLFGLAPLVLAPLAGCVAVAAGAAGYGAYAASDGRVSGTSGASLDRTYAAALAALQDMGLDITQKSRDSHSAHIEARTAGKTEVTLDLAKRSAGMTRIDVRWGVLGDEAPSKRLISSIKARL